MHRLGLLLGITLVTAAPSPARLGATWSANGHYYEAVYVPRGVTWEEAAAACAAAGGYLATITSAEENAFVFALARQNPKLWFQERSGHGQGPWLGGRRPLDAPKPDVGWTWAVTGESFRFTNWAPGEPNNFKGWGENRIVLFGFYRLVGSQWNDLNEHVRVHGYILERETPA